MFISIVKSVLCGLIAGSVLLGATNTAQAQQQGQWAASSCSLVSVGRLNLGSYEPNTDQDTTHEIGFRCTTTFPYNASSSTATFKLCLYMGEDAASSPGHNPWRYMSSTNSANLAYNLYADSARTQILVPEGMGSPLVSELTLHQGFPYQPVSSTGTFTVHARIPAGQQSLPSGHYYSLNSSFTLYYSMAAGSVAPNDCTQGNAYGGGYWGGSPIQLNAQVEQHCTLSTEAVDFGVLAQVGVVQTPIHAMGQLNVQCGVGTVYTLYLGQGNHPAGGLRQMANGSSRLPYQLFNDEAQSIIWNESNGVTHTATGNEQSIPVYGQISPGTTLPSELGTYTDTVIVTVSY